MADKNQGEIDRLESRMAEASRDYQDARKAFTSNPRKYPRVDITYDYLRDRQNEVQRYAERAMKLRRAGRNKSRS